MEDSVYPASFDCNFILKKARFFLGDRWILIGDIMLSQDKNTTDVTMPDVEEFLAGLEALDDGTFDWLEWGPRVN